MHNIAEQNMLLRSQIQLPAGLKLARDEFQEGWNFVRSGDARRLEKRIEARGWHIVKIADGTLRSGVGDTARIAMASALKLALRRVSCHFNAAEIQHIELIQYPWFFIARISIYPYWIQQGAFLPVPDLAANLPIVPRHRRLPVHSIELFPQFGCKMPLLRQMLVVPRSSEARPQ